MRNKQTQTHGFFHIVLTNNNKPYVVDAASFAKINVLKSDDTVATSAAIINSDGSITGALTNVQLSASGDSFLDVTIVGEDMSTLKTQRVILRVDPECVPDGTVISSSEFTDLQVALAEVAGFAGVKGRKLKQRGEHMNRSSHISKQ